MADKKPVPKRLARASENLLFDGYGGTYELHITESTGSHSAFKGLLEGRKVVWFNLHDAEGKMVFSTVGSRKPRHPYSFHLLAAGNSGLSKRSGLAVLDGYFKKIGEYARARGFRQVTVDALEEKLANTLQKRLGFEVRPVKKKLGRFLGTNPELVPLRLKLKKLRTQKA